MAVASGTAELYDRAKEIRRAAPELPGRDRERADEPTTADDAARGLNLVVRASLSPDTELPPPGVDGPPPPPRGRGSRGPRTPPPGPPPGGADPWDAALHELQQTRERLNEAGGETGVGKAFLVAARSAYAQARRAYTDGEYRRAFALAHGAHIWTHGGEHLWRAGYESPDARPARQGSCHCLTAGRGVACRRSPPPPPPSIAGRRRVRGPPPLPPDD